MNGAPNSTVRNADVRNPDGCNSDGRNSDGRHPDEPNPDGRKIERAAVIIGSGLAGSALARALTQRGWAITLIDDADPAAGSRQAALAVHPALAPDDSPASRLTRIALPLLAHDAAAALAEDQPNAPPRLSDAPPPGGTAPGRAAVAWRGVGRLQYMEGARALRLAAAWPDGPLRAVTREEATRLSGLGSLPGATSTASTGPAYADSNQEDAVALWWPQPCVAHTAALLERWQAQASDAASRQGQALRLLRATAARLLRQGGRWIVQDASHRPLADAPVVVLCLGARSLELPIIESTDPMSANPLNDPELRYAHLLQAGGWQALEGQSALSRQPLPSLNTVIGLQGVGHALPLQDGYVLRGPLAADRELDLLGAHALVVGGFEGLTRGTRVSVRDHLPLAGPVPDLRALDSDWAALARNDRLPLPRCPGLWTISALGGRGLLWCLPMAEHVAASLSGEASILDARLASAVDPGRFLRRALRAGIPNLTQALGLA